MSELVVEFLTRIIKGIFIYETLDYELKLKNNKRNKIVLIIFFCFGYYLFQAENYRAYIYRHIYTFLLLYFYSKRGEYPKECQIPTICIVVGIYEIINTVTNIITVIIVFFLPIDEEYAKNGMVILAIVLRIIFLFLGFKLVKRKKQNWESIQRIKYLIYFMVLFILSVRIPFLYTDIKDIREWKVIILSITFCTAIFFVILQLDRHNAAKEKARIEENNKKLNTKLHQSQEILPAVMQILNDVTINNGTKMEENKAHKLLEEVSTLLSQQRKENGKYDLKLKTFYSTGLEILDMQLNIYQSEAIEKKVNLDIFVQAPIDKVIKEKGIDQLRLQRAIGDLIRNAFNAIGRKQDAGGHILVVIGCQNEGILEIIVMDDGNEFPLLVLEDFGRRGNTLGGTGNGLADLTEFAKDVNASIYVEEFEEGADSFTKKISLIFDDSGINFIESKRKGLIKSSCGKK